MRNFACIAFVATLAASAGAQNWSDNFDSYATGSQLHGQGGWKGWFNDPGAGALTSGAQFVSAPNSVDIVGGTDLVHEYPTSGGLWTFSGNVYIPTAFTGQTYMILMSDYNDAGTNMHWSVQMVMNGTTNLVDDQSPNGGTTTPQALVRGQWVPFRVDIDLINDTKIVWYNGGQLLASRWRDTAGGTTGATLSVGAVDLFANGASSAYYDNLALTAVPEPATLAALGLGALGLLRRRRK